MKLSVFGLGYVGCVSAACFAKAGHDVIGVDVNEIKTNIINDGRSPIVETGIGELIEDAVTTGTLRAITSNEPPSVSPAWTTWVEPEAAGASAGAATGAATAAGAL